MKGMDPSNTVLILAAIRPSGRQAAVENVSHEESLSQLLTRVSAAPNSELKPFEVVLRVKVARGVPVESDIVAARQDNEK